MRKDRKDFQNMKMLAEDDAPRAERKEPLDRRNEESSEELGKGEHGSQSG